ncbi:MAG: hypothetical protein FWE37_00660 [Spirochaetaceae bacterium]|nr:hypothetical protein [Spirochaetaceae bacterium]
MSKVSKLAIIIFITIFVLLAGLAFGHYHSLKTDNQLNKVSYLNNTELIKLFTTEFASSLVVLIPIVEDTPGNEALAEAITDTAEPALPTQANIVADEPSPLPVIGVTPNETPVPEVVTEVAPIIPVSSSPVLTTAPPVNLPPAVIEVIQPPPAALAVAEPESAVITHLAPAVMLSPIAGQVLDLSGERALIINWQLPEEATDSSLVLTNLNTGRVILTRNQIRGSSFSYTNLAQLEEGNFSLSLQSFRRTAGAVLGNEPVVINFTLSLQPMPAPVMSSANSFSTPTQRIEWQAISRANSYRVIITNNDTGARPVNIVARTNFATVRLPAGHYTVTIIPINEFNREDNAGSVSQTIIINL